MGSQTKPSDSDNHGIFDGVSVSLFPGWQQRAKAALHAVKRKGHKKLPKMPSPLAGRITGKYLYHVIDEKPAKDGADGDFVGVIADPVLRGVSGCHGVNGEEVVDVRRRSYAEQPPDHGLHERTDPAEREMAGNLGYYHVMGGYLSVVDPQKRQRHFTESCVD